jgi:parallel beta-helix repeat protein
MSVTAIEQPFEIFADIDGQPLEAGYVWVGQANLDPQTNPIPVFFDAALTIPAAQPIRTLSGYLSNSGTPARLYANSDYSIRVMNKNGSTIYSAANNDGQANLLIDDLASTAAGKGAELVGFKQLGTGAVDRTALAKMRESVSVKDFGAVGDGVTDDADAINAAVTYANSIGGGVITFPSGTYMVNAAGNFTGIQMKSGVYLDLTGAKLKALSANSANYRLVAFQEVSGCGIIGGEIEGDRATNSATGEQGHCVFVILNCSRLLFQNITISNAFGDGIYLGRLCSDLKVSNCTVTNNRRNNISVVSASNVFIDGCDISNANGTLPEAGIDVEPNPGDAVSSNVVISNCHIYGNAHEGVAFPAPAPTPLIENAIVSNCHIYNNGTQGIRASYVKNLEVSGCVIYGNGGGGIYDTSALATSLNIDGNIIFGNTGSGVEGFASGTIISNNTIRNNTQWGIRWRFGQQVTISGNTISDHGEDGISYERAYNSSIVGNTVKNSQKHGIFITGTSVSSVTRSRASVISANTVFASSLLTDNTYSGIYLDANANTCTVNGNSIERAASGNQPLHAIYAVDASVIIVGNMTNNGAKSGNSQVRRAAVQPASFFNSPDFLANVTAEKFFPGLQFSAFITAGAGSPEGVQSAAVGSIWMRTNGGAGTTLYVKESGTGNTGWVAK